MSGIVEKQRQHRSPRVTGVRELRREDLAALQVKSRVPALSKIKETHRMLIRMLAMGLPQWQIARELGYSQSWVSIIANDPTVKSEVAKLSARIDVATMERVDAITEYRQQLALRSLRLANDQVEESEQPGAEQLPLRELLNAFEKAWGSIEKRSAVVNINVDFASRLEAVRRKSTLIDAKVTDGEVT